MFTRIKLDNTNHKAALRRLQSICHNRNVITQNKVYRKNNPLKAVKTLGFLQKKKVSSINAKTGRYKEKSVFKLNTQFWIINEYVFAKDAEEGNPNPKKVFPLIQINSGVGKRIYLYKGDDIRFLPLGIVCFTTHNSNLNFENKFTVIPSIRQLNRFEALEQRANEESFYGQALRELDKES